MFGWVKTFEVANVVVTVVSDTTPCDASLQAIVAPYHEVESSKHDVVFHIKQQGDVFHLILNQTQALWSCSDYRDIAPALEVHIYRQILDKTFPSYLSLHASCVSLGAVACVFAAVSGSGKSSVCTAALLQDACYFTDEFTLLNENGEIYPFPRPLQWDEETHPAFSERMMLASEKFGRTSFSFLEAGTTHVVTSYLWLPKRVQHVPLPLKYLIIPQYSASHPEAILKPIRRGEALMLLTEHMHQHYPKGQDIQQLNKRVPEDCEFFRLHFSDVHQAWALVKQELQA